MAPVARFREDTDFAHCCSNLSTEEELRAAGLAARRLDHELQLAAGEAVPRGEGAGEEPRRDHDHVPALGQAFEADHPRTEITEESGRQ